MQNKKNLTVITNSLVVSNLLQGHSNIKLIMAPGIYDEKSIGFLGPLTIDFFQKFNVDKAILGAQGFDIEKGATVADEIDATVKTSICKASKKRILMVDNEKLGTSFLVKYADIRNFNYLVTDEALNENYFRMIKEHGVEVVIANKSK